MLYTATPQPEDRQVSVAGGEALRKEALLELQVHLCGQALQVEPPRQAGTAYPHAMRIGIGGQPPAENVTNHSRPYGAFGTPRRHGRFVDRLPHSQVEPLTSADMVKELMLHRFQRGYIGTADHGERIGDKRETAKVLASRHQTSMILTDPKAQAAPPRLNQAGHNTAASLTCRRSADMTARLRMRMSRGIYIWRSGNGPGATAPGP